MDLSVDFIVYNDTEKIKFALSNTDIVKYSAKPAMTFLLKEENTFTINFKYIVCIVYIHVKACLCLTFSLS